MLAKYCHIKESTDFLNKTYNHQLEGWIFLSKEVAINISMRYVFVFGNRLHFLKDPKVIHNKIL